MFKALNVINRAQVVTAGVNSAIVATAASRFRSKPILARSRRLRHSNDVRWLELLIKVIVNDTIIERDKYQRLLPRLVDCQPGRRVSS
jgi:hypothetical protein